ncbi:Secondary metabolism regulator, partial [Lachnellula suecica]
MPPPPSPNDSAISVTTTSQTFSGQGSPKYHSPRNSSTGVPYAQLTPEQQAAQDLENNDAVVQAQDEIDIDSGADASSISDAGYETDSMHSASTSVSSSMRDYAFENGRRYHRFREGAYNFPNDDSEQEREDMKHAMMVNLCQTLHFAPIGPNPQNILDMGTGTGIWAIEMGEQYPGAKVLGVDLSPIQPEWVPGNVKFMVDDVESPWLRPVDHFDYIHGRHTVMAIKNWPKLMKSVFDHLKPGGWFELQEIHHYPYCHDGSMAPDHKVAEFWGNIIEGLARLGVNFNATLLLADMMREAGFTNVTTRIFHVPIGMWPRNKVLKMVGLYWRTILIDGLQPIALGPMTRGLGWSREQVEVWLVEVRKAYMEGWSDVGYGGKDVLNAATQVLGYWCNRKRKRTAALMAYLSAFESSVGSSMAFIASLVCSGW